MEERRGLNQGEIVKDFYRRTQRRPQDDGGGKAPSAHGAPGSAGHRRRSEDGMTRAKAPELADDIDLSRVSDRQIRRAMAPWWKREPGRLQAELDMFRAAGYTATPHVEHDGRLLLLVTLQEPPQAVSVLYPEAFPAGDVYFWQLPGDRVLAAAARASDRLDGVRRLLDSAAADFEDLPSELSVLMPAEWSAFHDGAGGTITYAEGSGPTLLAVSATGTQRAADLRRAARDLQHVFVHERSGWWVRGSAPLGSGLEQTARAVEERVAAVHALSLNEVREQQRKSGAPHALTWSDGSRTRWAFVLRQGSGRVLVGQPVPAQSPPLARRPYAELLSLKHVGVVGCGALGWRVATTLGRAGVRNFTLIDRDRVQYSNLPRLNAAVDWVGFEKVEALRAEMHGGGSLIHVDVMADWFGEDIGAAALLGAGIDLIIDTTASADSPQASNLLALATRRPAIFAWTADRVRAARIFRVVPGRTACYRCVQSARPTPVGPPLAEDTDPNTASEFVWEGANFNLDFVAAAVVRMAVLTLADSPVGGPNPDHFVMAIGGGPVPTSSSLVFPRLKGCSLCGGLPKV